MKINFKKVSIIAIVFIMFLAPVSVNFNQTHQEVISSTPISSQRITEVKSLEFSISINTANALSVECNSSAWNFIDDIACGFGNVILTIWEFTIFYLTQVIVVIVGLMLDAFLFFSIDGDFYRSGIIEVGWEILRDFTNIIFIFALLLVAFKMVLGSDSGKVKQTLMKTILVALVINFSLFFTYAIIDVSNVLAFTFYNKIEDTTDSYQGGEIIDNETGQSGTGGGLAGYIDSLLGPDHRSVSLAVASQINPQRIINESAGGGSFAQAYIIVTTSGILNILMIYVFGSIMLLFVGRSLGLMLLGITAPLAFATLVIPGMQDIKWIGFKQWFKQLLTLSFMAPIFIFLMYLIITFLGDNVLIASIGRTGGDGFLSTILNTYMLFFIIAGLLMLAKKITESLAGELGTILTKSVQGMTGALVAGAAIAATGGLAAAGVATRGVGVATGNAKTIARGKRMMSFKADVTQIPGFRGLTGKTATKIISSVTGKSALGHIDNLVKPDKDGGRFGFGNDYDKLSKKTGDAAIKEADDKSKAARARAEADHSAEIYQQQIKANTATEKPEYIKAVKDLKDSMDTLSKDEKELAKLQKEEAFILKNPNSSDDQIKQIGDQVHNAVIQKNISEDYVHDNKEVLRGTDGFKEAEKLENLETKQETAGKTAVKKSRRESAAKYQNSRPDIAQRIINKEKGKDDKISIEDVKKYMEGLDNK